MTDDPRMVRRYVIRDKIEDELEPPTGEFSPGNSQAFPASQVFIDRILSHTIGRTHVVFRPKIGKGPPEIFQKALVLIGNSGARGTPFPNAHEPYGISTEGG